MSNSTNDIPRERLQPEHVIAFMEINRQALTQIAQMNAQLLSNTVVMSTKWVYFLSRRLAKNLDLPRQVAACKTVEDMYKVYGDFLQTQFDTDDRERTSQTSTDGNLTPARQSEGDVAPAKPIPSTRTMLVRDAMTANAEWIGPDLPIREVARRMCGQHIGCLPVGENDRLIGMITDRDLVHRGVATGADPSATPAREVMSHRIVYCFDDDTLESAARLMREREVHHLPILNRKKRMVGILTMGDLAFRGSQQIFGDVSKLASRDAERHAHLKIVS